MSAEEWCDLPWYMQQVYMNGFREEGILKSDDSPSSPAPASNGQSGGKKIDLTRASLDDLGGSFTVRRAG